MPIYEYRCEKGHVFETMQSIMDDPLTACEQCGAPVERVFHPVAVHFKGSGFYNTDYGKQKRSDPGKQSGDSKKSEGDSKSSGSDSKSSSSEQKTSSSSTADAGKSSSSGG